MGVSLGKTIWSVLRGQDRQRSIGGAVDGQEQGNVARTRGLILALLLLAGALVGCDGGVGQDEPAQPQSASSPTAALALAQSPPAESPQVQALATSTALPAPTEVEQPEETPQPTPTLQASPTQVASRATSVPPTSPPATVEPLVTSEPTAAVEPTVTSEATPVTAAKPAIPATPANSIVHIVQEGDTLNAIAARYATTVEALKRDNGLTSDIINIGQALRVGTSGSQGAAALPTQPAQGTGGTTGGAAAPTPTASALVVRVPPGQGEVAILFNADAFVGDIPTILDTLRARDTRVTFFLTGGYLDRYPEQVKAIDAAGQEIASHGYEHLDYREVASEEIASKLERWREKFKSLTGKVGPNYWQPPSGYSNSRVRQVGLDQGYTMIYWTLDSLDAVGQPKSREFILNRVLGSSIELDGAIILMHVNGVGTVAALPEVLDTLAQRGLRVVTISELLRR